MLPLTTKSNGTLTFSACAFAVAAEPSVTPKTKSKANSFFITTFSLSASDKSARTNWTRLQAQGFIESFQFTRVGRNRREQFSFWDERCERILTVIPSRRSEAASANASQAVAARGICCSGSVVCYVLDPPFASQREPRHIRAIRVRFCVLACCRDSAKQIPQAASAFRRHLSQAGGLRDESIFVVCASVALLLHRGGEHLFHRVAGAGTFAKICRHFVIAAI